MKSYGLGFLASARGPVDTDDGSCSGIPNGGLPMEARQVVLQSASLRALVVDSDYELTNTANFFVHIHCLPTDDHDASSCLDESRYAYLKFTYPQEPWF